MLNSSQKELPLEFCGCNLVKLCPDVLSVLVATKHSMHSHQSQKLREGKYNKPITITIIATTTKHPHSILRF